VFFALIIVSSVQALAADRSTVARWMRNGVAIALGSQIIASLDAYCDYRSWQADTRALAAQLAPGQSPILVTGNIQDIPSADRAALQDELAFKFRMQMLTGRDTIFCDTEPLICADWQSRDDISALNQLDIQTSEDVVTVHFTQ
jgi:hypothetical protein